jgi:hypothetical protein
MDSFVLRIVQVISFIFLGEILLVFFYLCGICLTNLTIKSVNGSDSNWISEDSNVNPLKIYKIHMRIHIQQNFEIPNANLFLLL